jgi:hypothetical protein
MKIVCRAVFVSTCVLCTLHLCSSSAHGQGSQFPSDINGCLFGNMPVMTMHKGDDVRCYLFSLGNELNFHTPHWLEMLRR